jgi:hypothetical protein
VIAPGVVERNGIAHGNSDRAGAEAKVLSGDDNRGSGGIEAEEAQGKRQRQHEGTFENCFSELS